MAIVLKANARITNYDVYLNLSFMRIRKDIVNLLKRIENGESLYDIFPNEIVFSSVRSFLIDNKLLTESLKVSTKGRSFIETPYFLEEEEGVFSIDIVSFNIDNHDYSFIVKMTRKLQEDKREQSEMTLRYLSYGNSFLLENEKCIINLATNKSNKAYYGGSRSVSIELDISKGTYFVDNLKGELGQETIKALQPSVNEAVVKNLPGFTYNEDERCVFINSIDNLTDLEIATGQLNRDFSDLKFRSEPYKIRQISTAINFAYSYAYSLLDSGKFLSTSDLDDIFVNEILSGKNLHESIKDAFLSFKYSFDDFSSRLSKDKYEKLDYRIKITKELLDVDVVKESDKRFAALTGYGEVASYLASKVNPLEVDEVYLIMGYAFVENKKNPNRIVECLNSLLKIYKNITVVDKAPNQGNVNKEIFDKVKDLGVYVTHKPAISDFFHDRYIIFKLLDGTYEVYMCSSDIGQLFGNDGHVRGSISKQKIQDVTMKGRNLIEIATGK